MPYNSEEFSHALRTRAIAGPFIVAALTLIFATDQSAAQIQSLDLGPIGGGAACPCISADGSTVVGVGASALTDQAARSINGVVSGLGFIDPNPPHSSVATAASADGSVIVGMSSDSSSNGQAFRWTNGVMTGLGFLSASYNFSVATGVSDTGDVVVGYSTSSTGSLQAFKWTNGTITGLGATPSIVGFSFASGVSGDGTIVVGRSSSVATIEAVKWIGSSEVGAWLPRPSKPEQQRFGDIERCQRYRRMEP